MNLSYETIKKILTFKGDPAQPYKALVDEISRLRGGVKSFGFARQYGAQTATLMQKSGLSEAAVKEIVASVEKRWAKKTAYYNNMEKKLVKEAKGTGKYVKVGKIRKPQELKEAYYASPMGLIYQYDVKPKPSYRDEFKVSWGVYRPHILNKPSQGAGAIITNVPQRLLFKALLAKGYIANPDAPIVIVSQIHDAVVLDVKPGHEQECEDMVDAAFTPVRSEIHRITGWDPNVEFYYETEVAEHLP